MPFLSSLSVRIRWIPQDDILPPDTRPAFSSNVVEQFLHLIPGLTDQYIYMNDAYMIDRPTHPSDFFTKEHGVKLYLNQSQVGFKNHGKGGSVWFSSLTNTIRVIEEAYGFTYQKTRFLEHLPYVFYKEAMYGVHRRFMGELMFTSQNPQRGNMDMLVPYLHYAYVIHEGSHCCGLRWEIVDAKSAKEDALLIHWTDDAKVNEKAVAEIEQPLFLTVNDAMQEGTAEAVEQLKTFYRERYGHLPATFERK